MKILYIHGDDPSYFPNSLKWRCLLPSIAINRLEGHSSDVKGVEEVLRGSPDDLVEYDIIVIQRALVEAMVGTIIPLRGYGKTIVLDVDDGYEIAPKGSSANTYWLDYSRFVNVQGRTVRGTAAFNRFEELVWGAKLVHAVTAPSKVLLKDWSRYTGRVELIRNYPDTSLYVQRLHPSVHAMMSEGHPIVGWGGTIEHRQGLRGSGIFPALKLVMRKSDCRIMFIGDTIYRKMLVETKLNRDRIISHGPVDWEEYPRLLSALNVGLVPLAGDYDQRRSWIKALEYMLLRVPWVGSESPVLDGVKEFGVIVKNDPNEWSKAIIQQLENPDLSKVEAGYEFAKAQDINLHVNDILETYNRIKEEYRWV